MKSRTQIELPGRSALWLGFLGDSRRWPAAGSFDTRQHPSHSSARPPCGGAILAALRADFAPAFCGVVTLCSSCVALGRREPARHPEAGNPSAPNESSGTGRSQQSRGCCPTTAARHIIRHQTFSAGPMADSWQLCTKRHSAVPTVAADTANESHHLLDLVADLATLDSHDDATRRPPDLLERLADETGARACQVDAATTASRGVRTPGGRQSPVSATRPPSPTTSAEAPTPAPASPPPARSSPTRSSPASTADDEIDAMAAWTSGSKCEMSRSSDVVTCTPECWSVIGRSRGRRSTAAPDSISLSTSTMPHAVSASRVCSPGRGGGWLRLALVREKRGAGAGWTTPPGATKVPRAARCGCSGASSEGYDGCNARHRCRRRPRPTRPASSP